MGGSEYVVNMQYALHVEDYVRTYTVNADEFDNRTTRHNLTRVYCIVARTITTTNTVDFEL